MGISLNFMHGKVFSNTLKNDLNYESFLFRPVLRDAR